MIMNVKHGVHIKRKPNEVFAFVSDPDRMPQWQSTLHNVGRKANLANNKLKHGSRIRESRNVLGLNLDSEYEVVEYEQDRKLTLQIVEGPLSWRNQWTFEPQDGGTWFTAEGRGELLGLELPLGAANIAGQHLLEGDLATLRDLLERGG
jgi:uncharacterized protein YndB with AHSA1/START domain